MSNRLSAGIKGRRDGASGQEVRWLLQKNVVMQTFVQKQVTQETAPERGHDSDQTAGENVTRVPLRVRTHTFVFANPLFLTFYFKPHQDQSTVNESLSGGEHELVSTSLNVATLPLLVITRGRSQSLTNELPQGPRGKDGLSSHRSDSFDSLHFGRLSSVSPGLPAGVPRIIVISPTSESRLIKHDSACLEESVEALEDSVFTSLNFSSEVFQAVELLS